MKKLPKVQKNVVAAPANRQISNGADDSEPATSLVKADAEAEMRKTGDDQKAQALAKLLQAGGVKDPDLAVRIIDQVSRIQAPWSFGYPNEGFQFAIEMLSEMKPETVTEALLAVQMIGVHQAAITFLHKAALSQDPERTNLYVTQATRLMRLFDDQTVARARLKGNVGQQNVTVKHVHVYQGGQAIVGAVGSAELNQGEGGKDGK